MKLTSVDLDTVRFAWEVGVTLIGLFSAIGVMWLSTKFTSKTDFTGFTHRTDETVKVHDSRILVCEQALIHAPRKEDIAELADRIGDIARELAELRGEQKSQNNLLGSIHDHLLNKK